MLTLLTPSPLSDAARASLQPYLQPVLYALVMLASDCRQSGAMAQGVVALSLGHPAPALDHAAAEIAAHMVALGLPIDARVDGASNNNPFDSSFSSGETNPAILGAELLSRCRQLAVLIRIGLAAATAAEALETALELQDVALVVSRFGGQLAQALR